MAENSDELKMINHLLDVEKDANYLISQAMEESGKKIEAARAKYNAEYKQKIDLIIEELKNNYDSSVNQILESHKKQIDEFQAYLESKEQNYSEFSKVLEKLMFEK